MHRTGIWITAITVLAACLGGLFAGVSFGDQPATAVLVLSRTVQKGELIGADDLAVAEVTAPGVVFVPASAKQSVVGTRAMATLPAGSLLSPGGYGVPQLPLGATQVSLRLGPSQVPSCPLPGGARIILIGVPGPDDLEPDELAIVGVVVFPPVALADGTVVLDVGIDSDEIGSLTPYLLDRRITIVAI